MWQKQNKNQYKPFDIFGRADPPGIELRDLVVVCSKMRENGKEMCFRDVVNKD